jgi:predicted ATP-grasp superfamily ATP-dependent carboligase
VRRAGIDLAVLTYNRAIGNPDPPLDTYRDSVYLWGPILDVHAFLELRARGELTTRAWARSLLHRQHLQVFRATDPKPTLFDVTRRARLLVAGALRRRR